jgi:hypothetical protein
MVSKGREKSRNKEGQKLLVDDESAKDPRCKNGGPTVQEEEMGETNNTGKKLKGFQVLDNVACTSCDDDGVEILHRLVEVPNQGSFNIGMLLSRRSHQLWKG